MADLNTPDGRRLVLAERLEEGAPLVATALAGEFDVSLDTIRRDLLALEREGRVRRVRGGAIPTPVAPPIRPFAARAADPDDGIAALAAAAVRLIPPDATAFLDGGTTVAAVAARLPEGFGGLIVTPSPAAALAAAGRGARVHLIGGPLCADGANATGGAAEAAIADCAADLAVLGACGLDPAFGLAADDAASAGVARAMARAAGRVMVVTGAAKLTRRARHRVLRVEEIDLVVTDADRAAFAPLHAAGAEVHHV